MPKRQGEREVGDEPAVLRRRVAAQELALKAAYTTVRVKKELIEEETHHKKTLEEKLHKVILRQLDGAERVARVVQDLLQAIECPICFDNQASTALPCGHVFCCQVGCGSKTVLECPTCRQDAPLDQRTVLFGQVDLSNLKDIVTKKFDVDSASDAAELVAKGASAAVSSVCDMDAGLSLVVGAKVVAHFSGRKGCVGWYIY